VANQPLFEVPLEKLLPPLPEKPKLATLRKVATRDRSPTQLLTIARMQSRQLAFFLLAVLYFVAAYVGLFALGANGADELLVDTATVVAVGVNVLLVGVLLFTFIRLVVQVYDVGGIALMALLVLMGLSLLALVLVHFRANAVLQRNGIKVGVFGAKANSLMEIDPKTRHETQLPKLGW
jgi:hypothetical protein